MSTIQQLTVNPLRRKTWYWLKLNSTTFGFEEGSYPASCKVETTEGILTATTDYDTKMVGGAGEEFNSFLNQTNAKETTYYSDSKDPQTVRIAYDLSVSPQSFDKVGLTANENAELIAVEDYFTPDSKPIRAGIQTQITVERNAKVTLVQIYRVNDSSELLSDIKANVAEDGEFDLIQVVISGKNNVIGVKASLNGKHSRLKLQNGYSVYSDHNLDLNYLIPQIGRKTESLIEVNGVLKDTATKNFRGTIDFERGSSGSVGSERENVLLIDEGVRNKSLPIILCHEEDVEGTHGASIGKIDEDTLFYLQNRGLCEKQIYELLSVARILSVVEKIPDEKTRKMLSTFLEGSEDE